MLRFVLRLETVFSALLAVLTSAIVTLCTVSMSKFTYCCIACFVVCVFCLTVLIPISHSFNDNVRKKLSNSESDCYSKALQETLKTHYRNKEKKGQRYVTFIFWVAFVSLILFVIFLLKGIDVERVAKQSTFNERLDNIEKGIDRQSKGLQTSEISIKEIQTTLYQLEQAQQSEKKALSRLENKINKLCVQSEQEQRDAVH